MSFGSGTTGRGANLIFLHCAGLESSSEGRGGTLSAGEFGMDLGELRGDGVSRIDCNVRLAIVLNQRGREGLLKADGEEGEEMDGL